MVHSGIDENTIGCFGNTVWGSQPLHSFPSPEELKATYVTMGAYFGKMLYGI
ncbi:hypothetical protein [Laspinema olomoucense]|uniref:Uncharacterized protein n=1 Tax=Laspinema olomoucense D3b TaxID=2953688 RepID=A0ABT2N257_9CYAN|nr:MULTISPECIES: hypothetical protein [unclassified Laspinema]MCT7974735.1 hypothetical protein [Laspinema sp. D3d]MCT7976774.1 hypothetical protein [Laspinema sp. D3b]MCT7991730.1 hypothetical protein [Laspinema sp. D3a]MCT7994915.1 hypothetical protein [Laspinema sp. D3c]